MTSSKPSGNSIEQLNASIPLNEQEYWEDIANEASIAGDWEIYKLAMERLNLETEQPQTNTK